MKKRVLMIFKIFLGIVFLICLIQCVRYFFEYQRGNKIYEEARTYRVSAERGEAAENDDAEKIIRFDELKALNEDIIGWIEIEGTPIDYPIVFGADNTYYLTHSYDRAHSSFGSIFTDMTNSTDFSDDHTVIYGHNMLNDAMFGCLSDYRDQGFFDEHSAIHIYLPERELVYEIFSVYTAYVLDPTYTIQLNSSEEFQKVIDHMTDESLVTSELKPTTDDKLLTLSTCTAAGSENYRFVVNAVLVEDTENTSDGQ